MVKTCPKCKNMVNDADIFCPICGAALNESVTTPTYQSYSTGGNKNLKIAIISIVIIVAIVIALLLYFFVFSSNTISKNDLVGSWAMESSGGISSSSIMTFYENNSVKTTYSYDWESPNVNFLENDDDFTLTVTSIDDYGSSESWGTYSLDGNKLCMSTEYSTPICFTYKYDGNKILITSPYGQVNLVQTSEPEGSGEASIKWEEINISFSSSSYYAEPDWSSIRLTRSSTHYSGEHCPTSWGNVQIGDVLDLGQYTGSISGYLQHTQTGSSIKYFYFYN